MASESRGKYLVIEGSDGAGKTTQARLLRPRLESLGVATAELIEPGGTLFGVELRRILLDPRIQTQPETEFDLFTAARRELVHQVMQPQISEGTTLVCDRNWFSSVAYQGFGGNVDVNFIVEQSKRAMGDFFMPDGVVILDVPIDAAEERLRTGRVKEDWFEQKGRPFFEKVIEGYRWIAEKFDVPVIDGTPSVSEVEESVFSHLGNIAVQ